MELIGRHFGHIRVTQVVGQGGMGDVYGGYDEKLERKVALKVLNDDQRLDDEARERLLREARALSKLDHPNICRIHDYIETEDVDLLVLEYIDGKTLHDAMQERMTHHEKLRIATAIADVLVQAHRAGIVHRDLKPENVMLTKSGEVKVLDFGLARWLHRKGKSSDRHIAIRPGNIRAVGDGAETTPFTFPGVPVEPGARRDFLATAVGITLGTPLFMSPEQARGEELTPASDMYSFGLLLQSLFTGEEPHPTNLTAREVILRVASGVTQPVKGAPGDVTALINRLKQFARADRPTAVEAAERFRFFDAKPQRLARRAIVAALILIAVIGAWRYTVDLKRERAIALAARAQAQEKNAQAEDLINFMVVDLRRKLEPVGRLDVLDDVAAKTLQYASAFDTTRMSAPDLARNAKVLHQLGEVRVVRGDAPAALPLFQKSLQLSNLAMKSEPGNAEAQLAYGTSQFWIGNVYLKQKQLPSALAAMRQYKTVTEKLAREHPERAEFRLERAYGLSAVGVVLEAQGDLREALRHYMASLELRTEELRRNPADLEFQSEVAPAINKVGQIHHRLGDLAGARDYFRRELETYRTLVAADPKQTQWRQRMAVSLSFLALMHSMMGDIDGGEALWREELGIERELAAFDPENLGWQRNVFVTLRRLGNVEERRGNLAHAVRSLGEARAGLQELQKRAPNDRTLASYVTYADIDYARVLTASGSPGRARPILMEAIARLEASSDRLSLVQLASATYTLGETLALTDPARAEASWRRSEQLLEPLAADTNDIVELAHWSRVLSRRGRCNDARAVVQRLRASRFDTRDIDRVLGQNGCG